MCWACSTYGERSGICRVLVGKSEAENHLEDAGVDGRIILRWIFRKCEVGNGLNLSGLG